MISATLNFRPGVPTQNGRIYSREMFERILTEQCVENRLLVTNEASSTVELSEAVGLVKNWAYSDEGDVKLDVQMVGIEGQRITEAFDAGTPFYVTSSGVGTLSREGVITDYHLSHLFFVDPHEIYESKDFDATLQFSEDCPEGINESDWLKMSCLEREYHLRED